MACLEFKLPQQPDDLEITPTDERYFVRDKVEPKCYSEKKLIDTLEEIQDRLSDSPDDMVNSEVFDPLYSFICCAWGDIADEPKTKISNMLVQGLSKLVRRISQLLKERDDKLDNAGQEFSHAIRICRNSVKMYCFLLTNLVSQADAIAKNEQMKNLGRGRKKTCKKTNKKGQGSSFDWDHTLESILGSLVEVLRSDTVYQLWNMSSPEEEFGNMFFQTASNLLENPSNIRNKLLREFTFKLFAVSVSKFKLFVRASSSLMHLLHNFDHLVKPLAQLLSVFVNEFRCQEVATSFIREIGRINHSAMTHDSTGAKRVSNFMVELSSLLPKLVLANVSLWLQHLDGENYVFRNGVVQVMGRLVSLGFNEEDQVDNEDEKKEQDEKADKSKSKKKKRRQNTEGYDSSMETDDEFDDDDDEVDEMDTDVEDEEKEEKEDSDSFGMKCDEESRDRLFDLLFERAMDVSSFTRSKVLKTWSELVVERNVPYQRMKAIAQLAVDRLHDKSMVRKNAIILLKTLLEFNCFSSSLNLIQHKALCEKVGLRFKEKIEEHKKQRLAAIEAKNAEASARESGDDENSTKKEGESNEDKKQGEDPVMNLSGDEALALLHSQVEKCFAAVEFIETMEQAVPTLCQLLGSTTSSDVQESIQFFTIAQEFELPSSHLGIRKMLVLVWSKEESIKEAVITAYHRLYIGNVDEFSNSVSKSSSFEFKADAPPSSKLALAIAGNLIRLTFGATLAELTSLEELISVLVFKNQMPNQVVRAMWEIFGSRSPKITSCQRSGAIALLGYMSNAKPELIVSNLPILVSIGLGPRARVYLPLARNACAALQKLDKLDNREECIPDNVLEAIFQRIESLVTSSQVTKYPKQWYPAAEQAVNAIFTLHSQPEVLALEIIQSLAVPLFPSLFVNNKKDQKTAATSNTIDEGDKIGHAEQLSRLMFVLGQVSIKMLVHLENMERQVLKLREKRKARKEERNQKRQNGKGRSKCNIEEELAVNASEDYELELLRENAERRLIEMKGTSGSLLAAFAPVIAEICSSPFKYPSSRVQCSAALALCKMMCVTSDFCDKHLRLLFTILNQASDPLVRANVMIALGDMAFRFPNSVEPWAKYMYDRLRDSSSLVRKNTLLVLTHLILNDMLKAKGPISEMAKCLTDNNDRVTSLAKLFFQELSKKGKNPIYNVLPDVISRLSAAEDVTDADFNNILKFLIGYIKKDRQTEGLVEKLCNRFENVSLDTAEVIVKVDSVNDLKVFCGIEPVEQDDQNPQNICQVRLSVGEWEFNIPIMKSDDDKDNQNDIDINQDNKSADIKEKQLMNVIFQSDLSEIMLNQEASKEGAHQGNFAADDVKQMGKSAHCNRGKKTFRAQTPEETMLRTCRNVAYCLSQLNFTPNALKKLVELFRCYKNKLADEEVYKSFQNIHSKVKKLTKPEVKDLVEDFQNKLQFAHEKAQEDRSVNSVANVARRKNKRKAPKVLADDDIKEVVKKEEEEKEPKRVMRRRRKTVPENKKKPVPRRRGRRQKVVVSSSDESSSEEISESSSEEEKEHAAARRGRGRGRGGKKKPAPAQKKAAAPKSRGRGRRKQVPQSSSEEEEESSSEEVSEISDSSDEE